MRECEDIAELMFLRHKMRKGEMQAEDLVVYSKENNGDI